MEDCCREKGQRLDAREEVPICSTTTTARGRPGGPQSGRLRMKGERSREEKLNTPGGKARKKEA